MTDTGEGPGHAAGRWWMGQRLHSAVCVCDGWLICWLTDWFDDWLTDWLIDCCVMTDTGFVDWLTDLMIDWLMTDWFIDWLTGVWWHNLQKDRAIQLGDDEQDRDRVVLDKLSPGWQMADWFVDWLIDWLIDWLVCDDIIYRKTVPFSWETMSRTETAWCWTNSHQADRWLTDLLIDWLIGWLTDWCVMTDTGEGPRHAAGRRWAGQRPCSAGQTITRQTRAENQLLLIHALRLPQTHLDIVYKYRSGHPPSTILNILHIYHSSWLSSFLLNILSIIIVQVAWRQPFWTFCVCIVQVTWFQPLFGSPVFYPCGHFLVVLFRSPAIVTFCTFCMDSVQAACHQPFWSFCMFRSPVINPSGIIQVTCHYDFQTFCMHFSGHLPPTLLVILYVQVTCYQPPLDILYKNRSGRLPPTQVSHD